MEEENNTSPSSVDVDTTQKTIESLEEIIQMQSDENLTLTNEINEKDIIIDSQAKELQEIQTLIGDDVTRETNIFYQNTIDLQKVEIGLLSVMIGIIVIYTFFSLFARGKRI